MIFFKQHKVCFAFPPKTGTSTAEAFLLKASGYTRLQYRHHLPFSLKDKSVLDGYKVYSFLRNPLDRTVSCFKSYMALFSYSSYDEFINNFDKHIKPDNLIFLPQAAWFKGADVIALDFDNYEVQIRKATAGLGLDDVPVIALNQSPKTDALVTEKVVDFVKTKYAEDCALWKAKFGKDI